MSTQAASSLATESPNSPMVTVFNDPEEFNVKHPLQEGWTLWFDNPSKRTTSNTWSQNLREIITFHTVEDFWGAVNNIARPTEIPTGANYHLFKEGVKPMWEDPANGRGGKWVIQLPRKPSDANQQWLNTLLALIGETFEHEEAICGAVFSCRRSHFRISLWTRISDDRPVLESIGRQLRSFLSIPSNVKVEFSEHETGLSARQRFSV
ncbi:eukaryotic translation initiation factor 4E [Dimargaris xerosporica]|nr:eukaryotic translation initiation factor 4E [Dimargaris xerosporica]